jgi:hypothetical protein
MPGPSFLEMIARSGGTDLGGLHALLSLLRLILHLLTILKGLEALAHNVRMMDEEILPPVVGNDKSVSLLVTKPFHGTSRQTLLSCGPQSGPMFQISAQLPAKAGGKAA